MDVDNLKKYFKKREKQAQRQDQMHKAHQKQHEERSFAHTWIRDHGFRTFHDMKDVDWQRLKQDFAKFENRKDPQKNAQHKQQRSDKQKSKEDLSNRLHHGKGRNRGYEQKRMNRNYHRSRAMSHDPRKRRLAQQRLRAKSDKRTIRAEHDIKLEHKHARHGDVRAEADIRQRREATIQPGGLRSGARFLNHHIFHVTRKQASSKSLAARYPKSINKTGMRAFFSAIIEGVGLINKDAEDDALLDKLSPKGYKRARKRHKELRRAKNDEAAQKHQDKIDQIEEQAKNNHRARRLNYAAQQDDSLTK